MIGNSCKGCIQTMLQEGTLGIIPSSDAPSTEVAAIQFPYRPPSSDWSGEKHENPNAIVWVGWRWIEDMNDYALHRAVLGTFIAYEWGMSKCYET